MLRGLVVKSEVGGEATPAAERERYTASRYRPGVSEFT